MSKPACQFLSLLFVISISSGLAAQQDHVVLKNGDTLRGVVRSASANKITFETTSSTMTIDNREIDLYYDSEKKKTLCLRQINGPSKPVFITRLIDGAIRMYMYSVSSGYGSNRVTTTTWFAEKNNIALGEIKAGGLRAGKDERMEFFRSLIADNPGLLKQFDEDKKMKIGFMEELIREYNRQATGN